MENASTTPPSVFDLEDDGAAPRLGAEPLGDNAALSSTADSTPYVSEEAAQITEGASEKTNRRHPLPRLPAGFAWRRRTGEKGRPELCMNCQTRMVGAFCHECGQENVSYVISFSALLREMYGEFVQVDGRMVKTLAPLIIRPGFLTSEFLAGKRVRYLSPFKMYVVVSALFFLLFTILNPMPFDDADIKTGPIGKALREIEGSLSPTDKAAADKAATKPGAAKTATNIPPPAPPKPSPVRATNPPSGAGENATAVKGKQAKATAAFSPPGKKTFYLSAFGVNARTLPASVHEYREQQKKLPPAKRHDLFHSFVALKLIRFEASPADTLRGIIYATLPNVMVFMLPLFAVCLKVMYLRSRRLYVEHLIFVLHTHTFMFIALALVTMSPWKWVNWAIILFIPVYNFVALRAVYHQSFPKTLLKGFLLWNGYLFLFGFAGLLGLVLAIFSTLLSPD